MSIFTHVASSTSPFPEIRARNTTVMILPRVSSPCILTWANKRAFGAIMGISIDNLKPAAAMQEVHLVKDVKLLDCPRVVMLKSGENDASIIALKSGEPSWTSE